MLNISIVAFNSDSNEMNQVIKKCLKINRLKNIYIIDNSPQKKLFSELISSSSIIYKHCPSNPGYGAGHNLAIRESIQNKLTYHLVLNSDVIFDDDLIDGMIDFCEKHDDIGLVGPKMLYEDKSFQFSRKLLPTPVNMFARAFLPKAIRSLIDKTYQLEDVDKSKNLEVPYLSGAFMLFRCTELEKVGLFDDRFFMYPEDIDISRRFYEVSRIMYVPKFEIIHKYGGATKKEIKMFIIHTFNMIKYFNKWGWIFDRQRREFNRKTLKQLNRE